MEPADTRIFSVIVKIWVEDSGQTTWHGRVTHVPSGEQRYVRDLDEIGLFVGQFLEQFQVRLGACWRIRKALQRRRR
jgi:hypothetical protein